MWTIKTECLQKLLLFHMLTIITSWQPIRCWFPVNLRILILQKNIFVFLKHKSTTRHNTNRGWKDLSKRDFFGLLQSLQNKIMRTEKQNNLAQLTAWMKRSGAIRTFSSNGIWCKSESSSVLSSFRAAASSSFVRHLMPSSGNWHFLNLHKAKICVKQSVFLGKFAKV
jgi:hypothetical protein